MTRRVVNPAPPDLEALLPSWELHLRAGRKSPETVKSYTTGVRQYLAFCAETDRPAVLDSLTLNAFVNSMLVEGAEPATARARHLSVRRFSAWLVEEGELDSDPIAHVKAPKIDAKVVQPLTDVQLKALIRACAGKDLRDVRDTAVVRLMLETGMRAGEVVAMRTDDVDLLGGTAVVVRGKGGKGRVVPFGAATAQAIDRWLRIRRTHVLAARPDLWLGERNRGFSYDALHKTLGERAAAAGIDNFHPHLLRHTAAHRWLAAGGSEGGLMAVAGWKRPDMIMRYTQARASERAAAESRELGLGDL
jgi:site-specific recombinase XerD